MATAYVSAALVACSACSGAAPRPEASPPSPRSTGDGAVVCVDLRRTGRLLHRIGEGSLNGEELVDGLGDTAAQLKGDVASLRAVGRVAASALVDDLDRTLTRMRGSAQESELSEPAAGRDEDTEGEPPRPNAFLSIERRLEEARRTLRAVRSRLAGTCSPGGA
jgi:hypothetical protein